MSDIVYIEEDLVKVKIDGSKRTAVLAFGDPVEVLGFEDKRTRVRVHGRGAAPFTGTVKGKLPTRKKGVLQFSMVDVQQGDGMVIETPAGHKILIDGGDNKLFARYVAGRYQGSSKQDPLEIDAILITHGDADHFDGLNKIRQSETDKKITVDRKRAFIYPKRIFHNGLAKGGSKLKAEEIFGTTVPTRTGRAVVDLVDDLRDVDAGRLNRPFKSWVASIKHWAKHGPIDVRRLAFGDKSEFKFLADEDIEVEVLGPIPVNVTVDGKRRPGLPLLRTPPKTVFLPLDDEEEEEGGKKGSFSASHTVNGHSVTLRLRYGNVRFLLSGDLNQESMEILRKKVPAAGLQCEVMKVPHHGSADFDMEALRSMAPVVSLISSGDESSRKEHIHPRATLMGALGMVSRGDIPLVFCTELAAFFEMRGLSKTVDKDKQFFGFERTNFGIIQIRTDGERVLVYTHSGKENMKEAYRFAVDADHKVTFAGDVTKR